MPTSQQHFARDDWQLHAYFDGELDREAGREVDDALKRDSSGRELIENWRLQKIKMHLAFDSAFREETPESIKIVFCRFRMPSRLPISLTTAGVVLFAILAIILVTEAVSDQSFKSFGVSWFCSP